MVVEACAVAAASTAAVLVEVASVEVPLPARRSISMHPEAGEAAFAILRFPAMAAVEVAGEAVLTPAPARTPDQDLALDLAPIRDLILGPAPALIQALDLVPDPDPDLDPVLIRDRRLPHHLQAGDGDGDGTTIPIGTQQRLAWWRERLPPSSPALPSPRR